MRYESKRFNKVAENKLHRGRLVLDDVICLADSFEFTIYHNMKLNAFRHEWASLNRTVADKSHGVIVA